MCGYNRSAAPLDRLESWPFSSSMPFRNVDDDVVVKRRACGSTIGIPDEHHPRHIASGLWCGGLRFPNMIGTIPVIVRTRKEARRAYLVASNFDVFEIRYRLGHGEGKRTALLAVHDERKVLRHKGPVLARRFEGSQTRFVPVHIGRFGTEPSIELVELALKRPNVRAKLIDLASQHCDLSLKL